ncbi:MAG: UDP-N-acetylmuramoyl-L-alanine--D-glutamate ligase [Chthoniobacterales bacterium]
MTHYQTKNVIVLGLGRSGLAAARLLKELGAVVTVADSNCNTALQERAELLRCEGMTVLLGDEADDDKNFYDQAILSPGIEETSALVINVTSKKIPLIGEIELAYSACHCPIVAITGSNGKTTTTELTARVLEAGGLRTIACGNIGFSFSEAVQKSSKLDVIVVEVSSFQLETTNLFHANVAVWLNLSPNHLDRYDTMEEYRAAKMRIFRNQTAGDLVVVPKNFDPHTLKGSRVKNLTFSASESGADFSFVSDAIYFHGEALLTMSETHLRGAHNAENLMAAFAVGVYFKVDPQTMAKAVMDYTPPPHRCELVAIHNGVTWINDSKATTLDAMEKALLSVEKEHSILLIAGGKNKGSSFQSIFPLIKQRVKHAILIGEMRDAIAADWHDFPCDKASSLQEAVAMAGNFAVAGDTILLSPGTSSYDMFHDYVERGEVFKEAVALFIQGYDE